MRPISQRPAPKVSHSLKTVLTSAPIRAKQTAPIHVLSTAVGAPAGQRALRQEVSAADHSHSTILLLLRLHGRSARVGTAGTPADHVDTPTFRQASDLLLLLLLAQLLLKQLKVEAHALDPILHVERVGLVEWRRSTALVKLSVIAEATGIFFHVFLVDCIVYFALLLFLE